MPATTVSTAIPRVKSSVLSLLEEVDALKGIPVTDDVEPERAFEYIWLYKALATRKWGGMGGKPPLDEMVKVFFRIVSVKGGKSAAPSVARAFELQAAAENALRDAVTLNGAVRFQHVEDVLEERRLFDRKRGCHILMTISAKAKI